VRGIRPWDQFLDYAETVGRIEGSQTYAAMLNDGRLQKVFNAKVAELQGKPERPQLLGYSREAQQLHQIHVAVASLHRSMVKDPNTVPIPQGPVFPAERYEIEQQLDEQTQLDQQFDLAVADIYRSMKR